MTNKKKIILILLLFFINLTLILCDEIILWKPTEKQFLSPYDGKRITEDDDSQKVVIPVIGEVDSEDVIKEIYLKVINNYTGNEKEYPCDLFFNDIKTKVFFKTFVEITPFDAVIYIKVIHKDGTSYDKYFFLRTSYTNKKYEEDFDLLNVKHIHKDTVRSLFFSKDNKYLVSGSDDLTIKLMYSNRLQVIKTFKGHKMPVTGVVMTPDNKYIISVGKDRTMRIWDVKLRRLINTIYAHKEPIKAIALSPDGKFVATGAWKIKIWNIEQRREVKCFNNTSFVNVLCFTPDGKYLISGDDDGKIKIWDIIEESLKYSRSSAHYNDVTALTISPDGRYLFSGGSDGKIKWWTVLLNAKDRSWEDESNYLWERRLCYVKNRKKDPMYVDLTKEIKGYPVYTVTKTSSLKTDKPYNNFSLEGDIVALSYNSTGDFLLVATEEGEVRIYESFTNKYRVKFLINHPLSTGAFSYNGSLAAVGGHEGIIWLYGMK